MKNLFLSLPLVFLLFLSACSESEPTITVEGTATVKMPVDYVKFSVGLEKEGSELQPLVKESYKTMLGLKHILLEEWNIPDSLVQTDESSVRKLYNRRSSENSYRFTQTMTIVLDSLELYETLRRDLFNAGANESEIISFGNRNPQKYKEKAFRQAYQKALEKAKVLASSAGMTIGEPQKMGTTRSFMLRGLNEVVVTGYGTRLDISADLSLESTLIKKYKELDTEVSVIFSLK